MSLSFLSESSPQVKCDDGYIGPGITYTCTDGVWNHVSADNPTGKVGSCNCKYSFISNLIIWYSMFITSSICLEVQIRYIVFISRTIYLKLPSLSESLAFPKNWSSSGILCWYQWQGPMLDWSGTQVRCRLSSTLGKRPVLPSAGEFLIT